MVKAVVLTEPRKLTVRSFAKPNSLPSGLLIRVLATGVCGTDPHVYEGRFSVPYPVILGHEVYGIIEAIGADCRVKSSQPLSVGDRVVLVPGRVCGSCIYCKLYPDEEQLCTQRLIYGINMNCNEYPNLTGGYSEYLIVGNGFHVERVPFTWSDTIGLLVETLAVAMRAVERGLREIEHGTNTGVRMIIQGTGPVGLCALLAAQSVTIKPIVLDLLDHRLAVAEKLGAMKAVNITGMGDDELKNAIYEQFDGSGADLVIECAGTLDAFRQGLRLVRRGGTYLEMGHFADIGGLEIKPSIICQNDLRVLGSVIAPPSMFPRAVALLDRNISIVSQLLGPPFQLDQAEQALHNVMKTKEGIKTYIVP